MTVRKTQTKRVFIAFSDLGLGGVQTKIISLANTLVAQGIDCWVFLEQGGNYSRISLLDHRVKVITLLAIRLFNKRPFWGWRFALVVSLLTILLKPYAVFVSMHPLGSYIVSFLSLFHPRLAQKVVISEDTFPSLEIIYKHASEDKQVMRSSYNKAKYIVAVSQSTYNDLKDNYKIASPPLTLVPNGIHFQHASTPTGEGRDIDIVYGGRLTEQKRPFLLMELFSLILAKIPRVVIHLYGERASSPILPDPERTWQERVRCFPPTNSFESVLRRSKILVCTSLYEGLSITGMEAMKHGAVNACLDAPGSRDLVIRNKTGLLERSVASLAARVVAVLRNPALLATLRRNAYVYGKEHFSEANERTLVDMLLR